MVELQLVEALYMVMALTSRTTSGDEVHIAIEAARHWVWQSPHVLR